MNTLILVIILTANNATTHATNLRAGDITHCAQADGSLLFTDLPCPVDAHSIPWQKGELSILEFAKTSVDKTKRVPRPKSTRRYLPNENKAKCQAATAALKDLRAQRRSGYRISEEASLDRDEARNKSLKRQFC
ncbi:MAG: hypothetical protein GKR90_19140 [Pseudomonadales bacterium]|nr:hypothetical protein [Pseudomonadales bacterium]